MTILVERPFSSFCNTEKSVVPSAADTTTSPSMIAELALTCQASSAIFLKRLVQVIAAAGEYPNARVGEVDLKPVAIELDLVDPPIAGRHPLNHDCGFR